MGKVMKFKPKNSDDGTIKISMPSVEEVELLNNVIDSEKENGNMPDFRIWNGKCFKDLFNEVCMPYGEQNNIDPWDVLAIIIDKSYGAEFNVDNGTIDVKGVID